MIIYACYIIQMVQNTLKTRNYSKYHGNLEIINQFKPKKHVR